ncbi:MULTISPECIES: hypothetical protein [unclassified Nocardioides]|uniref:hypothetical protein n=1 Tax=unclassified Nocardioides TaxID=2615069 RepID=UPI0000EB61F2|nr:MULTISPECIES: hypothetical protein [unclassified Nocardioides]ABL82209.1 hypothetical protein Noca_2706 [Nocardioides sp. JS614]
MSMSVVEHQAYRRAWFSLLLYPLSFAAAFAVGEGLVSLYGYPTSGPESTPLWAVLAAGGPALLVFAVPAVVAWVFAARAGHEDVHRVRLPAYLATALAAAFVLVNLLSYVVGRVAG